MRLKYIIVTEVATDCGTADMVPFIFPEFITHKDMANRFGGKDKIHSAGFCNVWEDEGRTKCSAYGESQSLDKKKSEHDDRILTRLFNDY